MVRGGRATPDANQLAGMLRAGLRAVWGAEGGEVDVDSASCGLAKEPPSNGRSETVTRLEDLSIVNAEDLRETRWEFMNSALRGAEHRRAGIKLRPAATAEDPMASDLRRREQPIAQRNPQSACEIADVIAGGPSASERTMPPREDLEARW